MNLVIKYDRNTETPSLWQQALGEAVVGPKTGMLLDILPSTQTRWAEWKATHPDTTVLSTATGYGRNDDRNFIYPNGFIVGGLSGEVDTRLDRSETVLGVSLAGTHKAYPLEVLRQRQVVNDLVAGVPIVLIASPASDSARVYKRSNHQFKGSLEHVVELYTNRVWEISEEALANPVTGDSLERIPDAFVSFWCAWFVFHPDTLLYDGSNNVNIDPDARWFTTWGNINQ